MASTLTGLGINEMRRGGRSAQAGAAQASGLSVEGVEWTRDNLKNWLALSLYITAFTSEKIARRVLATAKKHVPYDTGDLYDSGYVSRADSVGAGGAALSERLGITTIEENVEGVEGALITNIQQSFSRMDYFGTGQRTFFKWVAGFTSDHAAVVHENPRGVSFQPPPTSKSGYSMPTNDPKFDHFMLYAFNQHKSEYSGAMMQNLATLNAQFGARAAGQKAAESKGFGLSRGAGAPRLVRR